MVSSPVVAFPTLLGRSLSTIAPQASAALVFIISISERRWCAKKGGGIERASIAAISDIHRLAGPAASITHIDTLNWRRDANVA
jgi:hypothetical protein